MTDESPREKCRKCGTETPAESRFCSLCGAKIYSSARLMAQRNFSVKLASCSSLIAFISILLFSFFTAYFYALYDQEVLSSPERLLMISIAGPFSGIFASTLFTSYIFTWISVKETFYGAAVIIIMFKVSDFILASTVTVEGIGAVLLSCLIAYAGSRLGFYMKRKFKFRNL